MLVIVLTVLVLAAGIAAVRLYGASRWKAGTHALRSRLEGARIPVQPRVVQFQELVGLPAPVQRYFRTVLQEGAPMIAGAHVRHCGTFNMGDQKDRWKPFTSDQRVVTQRPGFDWNATVRLAPGLPVRVHDAYVAGDGLLRAAVFGLFPVVNLKDSEDVAKGELMRFLAEAAWYPTALLPSQGVTWEAVDDRSAKATLADGQLRLTMLFTFNRQDLIATIRAEARGRTVGDQVIPTPWQGHFWNYEKREGIRIPIEGDVAWVLPEGPKPYWRGHIRELHFEFAPW